MLMKISVSHLTFIEFFTEPGDVIGCMMYLQPVIPWRLRKENSCTTVNQEMEIDSVKQSEDKQTEKSHKCSGSYIRFYKNGVLQNFEHENIYEGTYFAGVSLYMQATCRINFGGQQFKYLP